MSEVFVCFRTYFVVTLLFVVILLLPQSKKDWGNTAVKVVMILHAKRRRRVFNIMNSLLCTHGRSGCFLEGHEEQTEAHNCKRNDQTGRPEASLSAVHLSPTHANNYNLVHHYIMLLTVA